jgi:hypothetical protein
MSVEAARAFMFAPIALRSVRACARALRPIGVYSFAERQRGKVVSTFDAS